MQHTVKQRILSLLLAALTASAVLTSCAGGGNQDSKDTGTSAPSDSGTQTTEPETTADPTALPDTNLDGYKFVAFVRGAAENGYWNCVDIYMEDYTGDVLVDSVRDRNIEIEQKYNCTITQQESGKESLKEARNLITAGEKFDAICVRATYCASLAADGSLLDLFTMPHMQLGEAWWDQNAVSDLSIANKLYFTTGDISISCADALQIPVFNKTVLEQQDGMEDPYELVRAGTWTTDKMMEMAVKVNKDSNGDGVMTKDDTWGYLAYPWGALFLFFGSGETIVKKNADDIPELSVYNDRSVGVVDLLYKVQGGGNPDVIGGDSKVQTPMMSEDRVLFTITSLATVRKQFRENVESDIGILPVPKYEEEQDRYYNLVVFQDTANMYCVPKTCGDTDKAGFLLEALAQGSTGTLREAYYDKVISYKALRDKDSLEMLEIILGTRTYDLASAFNWGGWNNYFTSFGNSNGTNQFSSYYRKLESKTNTAIAETIQSFTQNAG
ncbi:MAG: extracellular solute-binding protein [Eubacteriales bacterium]